MYTGYPNDSRRDQGSVFHFVAMDTADWLYQYSPYTIRRLSTQLSKDK